MRVSSKKISKKKKSSKRKSIKKNSKSKKFQIAKFSKKFDKVYDFNITENKSGKFEATVSNPFDHTELNFRFENGHVFIGNEKIADFHLATHKELQTASKRHSSIISIPKKSSIVLKSFVFIFWCIKVILTEIYGFIWGIGPILGLPLAGFVINMILGPDPSIDIVTHAHSLMGHFMDFGKNFNIGVLIAKYNAFKVFIAIPKITI
jgi:hypothetical protein